MRSEQYQSLKEAVDRLLDNDTPMNRIVDAVHTLHSLLYSMTGILRERGDFVEGNDTPLPHGVAISPAQAAVCLFDTQRTTQFFRGIHTAMLDAQRRFPGQRIHVLYAGCGPYCLLILPLLTQFQPSEIGITLLDIHEESIRATERIAQILDVEEYIEERVIGDATLYQYPSTRPLHMLITETMKAAFEREPQVVLSSHLVPQLCEGGFLIPEQVSIEACLLDWQKEFEHMQDPNKPHGRILMGPIFSLTMESARRIHARLHSDPEENRHRLPCPSVQVPEYSGEYNSFYLYTTITIHKSVLLSPNQSQLNIPVHCRVDGVLRPGDRIDFVYRLSDCPGFEYSLIPSPSTEMGNFS